MPPGDPKAIELGCKCPSEPNQDGAGTFHRVQDNPHQVHFLVAKDCPIHGEPTWRESAPTERTAA